MSVSNAATGADQVQAGLEGLPKFTGAGIGIALIDSGVWTGHRSLAGRVVYSKDFVGDGRDYPGQGGRTSEDPYGHGTHIGATIAGSSPYPQDATFQTPFRGVAPGANLISLRVIGADGMGKASSVMDAIDWVIRNHKRFNIRVINLSLGGAAEESYRDDPMCKAVERAVHAGIVVVAAAGNRGKDAQGRSVHGLIESPGIDPYVITVGALNTKQTAARSDDELATYSSKGPTAVGQASEARHRGAGEQDCVGRSAGRVADRGISRPARVGVGRGRVCEAERDEHGDGHGDRRGGAGARGEQGADAGAGEDDAAVVGDVHA